MSWRLTSRPAVVLLPLALIVLSVLTVSVLYSQTPGVTVVPVGTEPRGLAYNLATNRAVVTNHNTNTVTVANLTTFTTTTVTVGAHPWGVAINTATNKAYVANEQSDTVSVLNLATNTVTATIPVGENPKEIAVNASTNTGLVANTKSDTVSILNLATNTVSQTIAVGVDPQGVVVNASTNTAYVSNAGSDTVSVINLATNAVTATIAVGDGPAGIDLNPGTQRLVVANRMAGTVTILNTSTNAVVATVTVGEGPSDVAINPSTNRAYVTNTFSDSVSVINLSTNTVIATYPVGQNPDGIAVVPAYNVLLVVNVQGDTVYVIDLNNPPSGSPVPVGKDPEGVAIDLDTNTAVTANAKSNDLSVVDLTTATELTRISVGKTPRDVAIHPTSKLLIAANSRANTASIIDLPTRTVVATVPVGRRPRAVAIDPILNVAAVANERDSTLSLIDLSTRTVIATLPAGSHPTDVAIHPTTHVAVVANKKTDQVTLIDLVNRVTIGTVGVGKDPVSVAINPATNTAVVANEKAGTLSVLTLSPAAVTATIPVLARPTGVAINPSTNVAAVVGHTTDTLMLVDLATNTVQTTLPAGREPQQVAINPFTNIAAVTNEEPPTLWILQLPNPVPVLDSLVPVAVTAGDPGFTLTLNGAKFVTPSTVTFGTQTYPAQFMSNEQLQADIPATAITTAGTISVSVTNPSPGGGTSNSLTFTINNPVPVILTLTPASVTAGDPAFTLTVDGTGFVGASSVLFNGQVLVTTFVSAARLTASVPAEVLTLAGLPQVTVVNPAPGGGTSNAVTFTVNNPVPTTTSISPTAVIAGAPDTTITVNGTNFVGTSVVQLDGTDLATVILSNTQLQATIPAARLASAGIVSITVANPAPGGGVSNAQPFTVNNPVPTLTAVSPPTIDVGSPGVTLTLTGTNFVSTSTASVGGTSVPTTVISATQLTAQVPASLLTTAGALLVTVTNPATGGGTSNSLVFTVTNPVPTITAISPTLVVTGDVDFTLTVTGTGFVGSSSVAFDGQPLTTTYTSATELTAIVPASAIAVSHTAQVTVVNPAPGGGTSNAAPLIANARPVAHGGPDRSVTVGKPATLDGRQSEDPDGDRLTFAWSLVSAPTGSVATLANPTSVQPSLTPDVAGTYQVRLIVNDGQADSAPVVALVTAVVGNAPPDAEAGADHTTVVGQAVTLDGRRSRDPDDDRLTYQWSLVSAPTGSTATITEATEVLASLTPDVAGDYLIQLIANDGTANSAPSRVIVSAASPNVAPMATAGRDRNVLTGSVVSLDGSASLDPNGDALVYRWTIVSAPSSSTAALANATTATPAFTPDVSGEYLIRLVVNDGATDSAPDTILIRADAPNPGPNAVAGSDQLVYQTDTVTLDGTGSNDPNNDPLAYQWLIVSTPANSQAALSDATVAQPTFLADEDGLYVVRLTVSDGVTTSSADVVVVKTRALLSIAVTPINPSIIQGQTQAFTATGTFEDQTTRTLTTLVTWSSSDQTVATVNTSGVATGLVSGTTQIQAAYGAITSPAQTLTVINPTPTIASFSPLSGPVGATITITGTNFDLIPANNQVRFNGTVAQVTSSTATTLQAVVPAGATTGPISVTTAGGSATSSQSFYVIQPPTITSFTPTSGPIGTAVTITGTNFNTFTPGDNQLRFAGTRAILSTVTATSITTTVPLGATTGPITLTNSAATATGPEPFTVTLSQDFGLTLTPSPAAAVQGDEVHVALQATGTNGFSGIVNLTVSGLPADATPVLSAPTITTGGLLDLTLRAATTLPAGSYPYTLTGTSSIDGQTITRTANGILTVQSAGVTTITGQVLNTLDEPLEGVIITMDGQTTTTDAGGNFILPNVVVGSNRVAFVDGRPVVKGTEKYPIVEAMLNVRVGIPNRVPYIIWLPALSQHLTHIDPSQDTVVTNPDIPDMQVLIPKGIVLTTLEGTTVTDMSITQVPIERAPMPLPEDWTVGSLFSIQPGGALANRPIPVIYPNLLGNEPGTRANLFFFDVEIGDWRVYGQGTVSQDGRRIIPDPGVGQPRTAWGGVAAPPPPPLDPIPTTTAGDPVLLTTGQFTLVQTDMVLPGRIPVVIRRAYRSPEIGFSSVGGLGVFGQRTTLLDYNELLQPVGTQAARYTMGYGQGLLSVQPDGTYTNTTDPSLRGVVVTRFADGSGQVRLKEGTVKRFDVSGRLMEISDRNGNIVRITRNPLGLITEIQEPAGRAISFGYDDQFRLARVTDPIGRQVQYGYDDDGRLVTVRDPAGGLTRYTYDGSNRLLTITDPRDITYLTNEYDPTGRVIRQTAADGGVTQFDYTLNGTIISQTVVTDPLGNLTTYRFNSRGYQTATIDALGHMTRLVRDFGTNLVQRSIDPLNRVTQFTYDLAGNITSVIDPAGNVTLLEYEPTFNRLVKQTDALGQVTRLTYDAKGNLVTSIDPLGNSTALAYNSVGQPTTITDSLGYTVHFDYDAQGDLITISDPLGNQTKRIYDTLSRLVTGTDPKGQTTQYAYDALNRVTQISDALSGTTSFGYDSNGNLLAVTDAKNQTTTYTYDSMDRLETRTDALIRVEQYDYDPNGKLTQFTDRKGQISQFTYDPVNRRSQASYGDGTSTTFTYDGAGRLAKAEESTAGVIEWSYDVVDRLVQELTPQGTVQYTYDALGRRTGMTANGQTAVSYQYDAASRLTQVAQGNQIVGLTYDAAGLRTGLTYPNGTTTSYSYDAAKRLTNLLHQGPTGVIENLTYAYDAAGNRVAFTRANEVATSLPNPLQAAYDAANEQVQFNNATPNLTYDANGNLTSKADASGTTTYTWDARNRLAGLSGVGLTASFVYDALGRRVSKAINGVQSEYLYDGQDIAAELGGGTIEASYLRSRTIDDPFVRRSRDEEYYHGDALGSILRITDEMGTATERYTYEPFGETTNTGSSSNPVQYTGRENDETGLYYYRARYYSPTTQRFLSEDPIWRSRCIQRTLLDVVPRFGPSPRSGTSSNAYAYVDNNPIRYVDPSGLEKNPRCINRCTATCGAEAAQCGWKVVYLPVCELVCVTVAVATTGGAAAVGCGFVCAAWTAYETYECLNGTRQCMTKCVREC